MRPFEFATATRIVFGQGTARGLADIIGSLGGRPFLVTGAARRHAELIRAAAVFPVAGEPTFDTVRAGVAAARDAGADVVVSIGGGSAIDAGKAIAMLLTNEGDPLDYAEVIGKGQAVSRPAAPFIAVPTTAGTGSEATRNAVLLSPRHGVKVSLRSPLMLPRVALVDPELAVGAPPRITAACGMDALAQLIEPFLSSRATPLTDALCRDGLPRIARSLPRVIEKGDDLDARADMALAALYSGMALANAGLGAVHGLASPIGGGFGAPHGEVCAALLPGVFEANFLHAMERPQECFTKQGKFEEVARLLTGKPDARPVDAVEWLREMNRRLGIPRLSIYGIRPEDASGLAARALETSSMKGNPVPLRADELERIVIGAL
ncbi:MAG: iron-containing alcohol dehydrogenase [Kiritimatiellae bacterium]|nr:iron-containing alcohol dehydrogenase [Kiritimatiellia bacterium]MDW8457941.1 iron-containing alcohol dehydrogenase [Verrucomicrobiota bacterium]